MSNSIVDRNTFLINLWNVEGKLEGGAYNRKFFLFTGRWAYDKGGGLISGEGGL